MSHLLGVSASHALPLVLLTPFPADLASSSGSMNYNLLTVSPTLALIITLTLTLINPGAYPNPTFRRVMAPSSAPSSPEIGVAASTFEDLALTLTPTLTLN